MKQKIYERTAALDFFRRGLIAELHFWYNTLIDIHSHDYYEIMIVTKGRILHVLNDNETLMPKKAFVLIRPGDTHKFSPFDREDSECVNISMEKNAFQLLCETILPDRTDIKSGRSYFYSDENVFNFVIYLANFISSFSLKKALPHIKTLIVSLLIQTVDDPYGSDKPAPEWLTSFIQQLSSPEVFTKPVNDLYAMAPANRIMLEKVFKEYTNKTIISFVTEKRIAYACGLLRNTNYTIEYIATMTSYFSMSHFCRVFKKFKGVTPSQYRKKYRDAF